MLNSSSFKNQADDVTGFPQLELSFEAGGVVMGFREAVGFLKEQGGYDHSRSENNDF